MLKIQYSVFTNQARDSWCKFIVCNYCGKVNLNEFLLFLFETLMALYYSGSVGGKKYGLLAAILKQIREINLNPVKKIDIQFDPFHYNAKAIRNVSYFLTSDDIRARFINCAVNTSVVCDRSEPTILVKLLDEKTLTFKAGNLDCLEVLKLLNEHVTVPYLKSLPPPAPTGIIRKRKRMRKPLIKERRY